MANTFVLGRLPVLVGRSDPLIALVEEFPHAVLILRRELHLEQIASAVWSQRSFQTRENIRFRIEGWTHSDRSIPHLTGAGERISGRPG